MERIWAWMTERLSLGDEWVKEGMEQMRQEAARIAEMEARAERAEAMLADAREAMEWYDHLLLRCNALSPDGEVARATLAKDRGTRIRVVLARMTGDDNG